MSKAPTHAVIDVGGIGYGLAISLQTFDQLPSVEEDVRLFTHLHVREDRMELFGFAAAEEREVFELLIAVSGIGPNSALTILSGMTLRDLQDAILQERVNELTQIKGIGRKTAERLVLDLRDKVQLTAPADGEEASETPDAHAASAAAIPATSAESRAEKPQGPVNVLPASLPPCRRDTGEIARDTGEIARDRARCRRDRTRCIGS